MALNVFAPGIPGAATSARFATQVTVTDTEPPEMKFATLVATVGDGQATWSEASVAVTAAVADDWASAALLWTTAASAPARAAASTSP